jgi:hypothetical protein
MIWRTTWILVAAVAGVTGVASAPGGSKPEQLRALSDELFTNASIRHLRLEITRDGITALRRYRWQRSVDPDDRPEVPCVVREGDRVWTNVAVHLKGAAGSFRPIDSKPALTLNFDKWVEGQSFHGLEKISLNNSVQDPAYLNEKLTRELYDKAGVPVPRADYATVELNGRHLGLYVLVEGYNKQFLKHYFADTKGNLYDSQHGQDLNNRLEVTSGKDPDDQSELEAVVAACQDRDPTNRYARLQERVDLDRFFSLMALDCMTWNWDGYAMNKNNYRVFHDRDEDRIVFMPHGLDQMFWKPDGPILTGRNGMVARALVSTREGRTQILERVVRFRRSFFTPEALHTRLQELSDRVQPVLKESGSAEAARHRSAVNLQRQRMTERIRSIDEQLEGLKHLLQLGIGESAPLINWQPRTTSGNAVLTRSNDPPLLHIRLPRTGAACWATTVWLEEGAYSITGRVQTRGVEADIHQARAGAGFRVWSHRKQTSGPSWGWFPYRESRDFRYRGEVTADSCIQTRLIADSDWTDVTYEIELRQPIADLEIYCELTGASGEAWFEPESLRITRRTDECP